MQLVHVVTVGLGNHASFLVASPDRVVEDDVFRVIDTEYGIDPERLYIQETMKLFDGDLPLNVGDIFEWVCNKSGDL